MPKFFSAEALILGSGILTATGNSLYLNGVLVSGVSSVDNIGDGSGIYSGTLNNRLQFKTLKPGSGIQISGNEHSNSYTFIVTGIGGGTVGVAYDPYTARYYV